MFIIHCCFILTVRSCRTTFKSSLLYLSPSRSTEEKPSPRIDSHPLFSPYPQIQFIPNHQRKRLYLSFCLITTNEAEEKTPVGSGHDTDFKKKDAEEQRCGKKNARPKKKRVLNKTRRTPVAQQEREARTAAAERTRTRAPSASSCSRKTAKNTPR